MKKFFTTLLAGLTLGVLFSPKKGEDTRKEIKDEVKAGGTGLNSIFKSFKGFFTNLSSKSQEVYKDASSNQKVKTTASKLKKYANNLKDKITKTVKKAEKKSETAAKKGKKIATKAKSAAKKTAKTAKKQTKKVAKTVKKEVKI